MLFNSYIFLVVFLPVVVLVYWRLPARLRAIWILAVSGVFYAYASLTGLLILLAITLVNYVVTRDFLSSTGTGRRRVGIVIVLSNLVVLFFFKYFNFLALMINSMMPILPLVNVALPLGISFYTFNLIGYGLDVYRGQQPAATSLVQFASYVTFFPTISSGPLLRYGKFSQQQTTAQTSAAELGIFNLSIGLAKKLIIADQLATAVNPLFSNYAQLDFFAAWIAVLGYTYQLYFDFSGYTDIAIGIGYLLGFQLPQNFNAPYTARNITDFWQRWHITLSNWFRDYLFFPLSRALLKRNHSQNPDRVRTISHLTTMALIGLWHGANWTFVIWGVYHGIMLAIHSQTRAKHWRALSTWLSRALTFFCVVMGWVIFRSTSLDMAAHIYEALFGLRGFSADLQALSGDIGVRFLLVILSLIILTNLPRDTWALQPRQGWVYAAGMAALLVICLLALGAPTPFLYFQF